MRHFVRFAMSLPEAAVLMKTECLCVNRIGYVPHEVIDNLNSDDDFNISRDQNFFAISLGGGCICWELAKRPVSYVMPTPTDDSQSPAVVSIVKLPDVPGQASLAACSRNGTLWYWDNITFAEEPTKTYKIPLAGGDTIMTIQHCDPVGFVICTAQLNFFRATWSHNSSLNIAPMVKQGGLLKNILSVYSRGNDSSVKRSNYPVCIVSGSHRDGRHTRTIYIVTQETIQVWSLHRNMAENFIADFEIQTLIQASLLRDIENAQGIVVRILDAVYYTGTSLLLLVGFSDGYSNFHYCSILIDFNSVSNSAKILEKVIFQYTTKGLERARFEISADHSLVYVQFNSCLIVLNFDKENQFEEYIFLRRELEDSILGCLMISAPYWRPNFEKSIAAAIICKKSGVLSLDVNSDYVHKYLMNSEKKNREANAYSALEQAVFFSHQNENPIRFNLEIFENEMNFAIQALSSDVLHSRAQYLHKAMGLRYQLEEKVHILSSIPEILQADLMTKLPSSVQLNLYSDLVLAASALALFNFHSVSSFNTDSVLISLDDIINQAVNQDSISSQELLKCFYLEKADSLPELLASILKTEKTLDVYHFKFASTICELNKVILVIFKCILHYEVEMLHFYTNETAVAIWTSI
ncbi:hypothetical protein BJ742DRAFT_794972 [Cladochytrium replicatum]|nr:hypothetical protein BJ742DRAFT_794972 [Cladochytrium replicatum]